MATVNKTEQELNAILDFQEGVTTGDDKGLRIIGGQMTIEDNEFIAGKDSYPVPRAFHCKVSNTTGLTITSAIDVTEILQSDSGSTIGLIGGILAGDYILVMSSEKYSGFKLKTETAGVIEPDNIEMELVKDNAPTYVSSTWMVTDSSDLTTSYGEIMSTHPSEQVRIGINPLNQPTDWDLVTFNVNGESIEGYWGRIIITSDITSDAIVQQVKLHSDRIELDIIGQEFYGETRYNRTVFTGLKNAINNNLSSPANEAIYYGVGTRGVYVDNEFANNATDSFIIPVGIESWIDTSIPLTLTIKGYPKSDDGGTVKFGIDVFHVHEGYVFGSGNVADFTNTALDTFPAGTLNTLRTASFNIPINSLIPGEKIIINFYRLGSDTEDTLNNSAVIEDIVVTGYGWKL